MMLFKLSLKNIKKSFKDYLVYFFTLVLGVSIFYMFNSIDSQETMLQMTSSTREIVKMLISMLGFLSIFISIVLAFLIIYANNFLIKRRKKEFGTYMLLGMSKGQISRLLVIETILVGTISLCFGLIIGIFGSQFMSVLVAKMFEVNMTKFEFVFSPLACAKTLICFSVMYIAVLLFNTITVSKYKLIDLLNANKKNEVVKIKNKAICICVFIISIITLIFSYYKVTIDFKSLMTDSFWPLLPPILGGTIGTLLFFWSLSGFILELIQNNKSIYLKNTNMFILRQLNNKINTTVISMTVICIMLFVTICVLSSALSLNNSFKQSIIELTPVDMQISKICNLNEEVIKKHKFNEVEVENSYSTIADTLARNNFDMNSKLKDITYYNYYNINDLTLRKTLGESNTENILKDVPHLLVDHLETIMTLSDYNKIAALYETEQFKLEENEYIIIADFDSAVKYRNMGLSQNNTITIHGNTYKPKYNECKKYFVEISGNHINSGIIIVPDSAVNENDIVYENMVANYNTDNYDEKVAIDTELRKVYNDEYTKYTTAGILLNTKLDIYESSTGLTAMIIFLALYLGIIFLIASSAVLALKELTDSSDNKQRYSILRKIGTDENMLNKSLFMQIGTFFLIPLSLAIIHSIFGIIFALKILETINPINDLISPIITTGIIITLIYGGYFLLTYVNSKNIIKEDN